MIWTTESKLRIFKSICGTKAIGGGVNIYVINHKGIPDQLNFVMCSSCFFFTVDKQIKVGRLDKEDVE